MDGRDCVHDGLCKDIKSPSYEDNCLVAKDFAKKTTLKDRFEVLWNFKIRYVHTDIKSIRKNEDEALSWSIIGKQFAEKNDLMKSIEAYTKSIAFAPVGSRELSLAYANRSAVLFKAGFYNDCLLDIERSLKIGYPDNLKTKLHIRQSLCFKALKPSSHIETGISMANAMQWLPNLKKVDPNYDIDKEYRKMINQFGKPRDKNVVLNLPEIENKNPQIIGAADSIELKTFNDNKQYLVATRDIEVGECVYVNKPLEMIVSIKNRYFYCWHCCLETLAGIPCDECPNVIYCSNECKDAAWDSYHDIECLYLQIIHESIFENVADLICPLMRTLIKSLKFAGGVVELKKKIDEIDSMKDKTMRPTNSKLDFDAIDNFLTNDYYKSPFKPFLYKMGVLAVRTVLILGLKTNVLGKNKTVKELYANEKSIILGEIIMRYLMNLTKYLKITRVETDSMYFDGPTSFGVIQPIRKFLKYSFDYNVMINAAAPTINGLLTVKPIKKGDMLQLDHDMKIEESDDKTAFDGNIKMNKDNSKQLPSNNIEVIKEPQTSSRGTQKIDEKSPEDDIAKKNSESGDNDGQLEHLPTMSKVSREAADESLDIPTKDDTISEENKNQALLDVSGNLSVGVIRMNEKTGVKEVHIGQDLWLEQAKWCQILFQGKLSKSTFTKQLANILFTPEDLKASSSFGRSSNNYEVDRTRSALDPIKIMAIQDSLTWFLYTRQICDNPKEARKKATKTYPYHINSKTSNIQKSTSKRNKDTTTSGPDSKKSRSTDTIKPEWQ